jgi:hypothetical protein
VNAPSHIPWRNSLIAAYLFALVPAIATALLQPVWSLVDESDHYDLVAQYAHGMYPSPAQRPTIRPETLQITVSSGTYGYVAAGTVPRPLIGATFEVEPPGLNRTQHNLWVTRHFWQFSKEAGQAPLFYIAAVPIFALGDWISGPTGALLALRLFNVLLTALLAPIAFVLSVRLWPGARKVAAGAALLTAVLAGPVLDFTHVTNDTLAAVLVGACLVVATGAANSQWTARRAALLGLWFGAACLTRVPDAAIAPALFIPLLRAPARVRITNCAVFIGVSTVVVSPWLVTNLVRFGSLTQLSAEAKWWPVPPPSADPAFWALSTLKMVSTFLVDVPYGVLPSAPWLTIALAATLALSVIGAVLAVFSAVGLWRAARDPASMIFHPALAVLATATAGITVAAILTPLLVQLGVLVPGRYLYPALPAIAALLVAGLVVELKPAVTRAAVTLLAALSVVVLAVFLAQPMSGPQGPGHPVVASSQLRSDQGSFGPLTVTVDECAVVPTTGIWVQVTAVNSGSARLDWMPAPVVSANGAILATSDYRRSTQLPGTLEAAQSVTGWLWLGDQATLGGARSATLTFPGVAYDSYHQVGDLQVMTELC